MDVPGTGASVRAVEILRAIRFTVGIDESRRLQLELPADTAVGEAEVIVLVRDNESASDGNEEGRPQVGQRPDKSRSGA